MDITCDKCQSKFKIPDEKIPAGKVASLACPKCKEKITVGPTPLKKPAEPKQKAEAVDTGFEEVSSDVYDASEKPFDFVEEEGKTALICESDPGIKDAITKVLTALEYHITDAESGRDALKKMRYHNYDLILVNEEFDTADPDSNGVLIYLERMNMALRRDMFVVLISNRFRTLDNMMAFNKSVNIIVNVSDIKNFDKILNRSITEHDFFYRVYRDMLRKTGRI
ncbi:zinc-ribbon domain-containing protein [Thermodesulfobacteriota bacterium]